VIPNSASTLVTQTRHLHNIQETRVHISLSPVQFASLRSFASSRRQRQSKGRQNNKDVLANEELVARLIRDAGGASANKIAVRLVIDEGPSEPATVKMTNLSEAVELSLDRMVDLIGVSLDTDLPVIRLAELAKLQYKADQAQKKQQQNAAASKNEQKSFRFKAGIDSHDLERKVAQLSGYLQKGSDCEYTVFTRARTLRDNPDAGIELVEKIQSLIADYGVLKREPETNETKSFYRVKLRSKK
jgi:translation initiation factor IF-3